MSQESGHTRTTEETSEPKSTQTRTIRPEKPVSGDDGERHRRRLRAGTSKKNIPGSRGMRLFSLWVSATQGMKNHCAPRESQRSNRRAELHPTKMSKVRTEQAHRGSQAQVQKRSPLGCPGKSAEASKGTASPRRVIPWVTLRTE